MGYVNLVYRFRVNLLRPLLLQWFEATLTSSSLYLCAKTQGHTLHTTNMFAIMLFNNWIVFRKTVY